MLSAYVFGLILLLGIIAQQTMCYNNDINNIFSNDIDLLESNNHILKTRGDHTKQITVLNNIQE